MIKVTEKNRGLVFLAATMIIGVLAIGVLLLAETSEVPTTGMANESVGTNFKILEGKIESLKRQKFNPSSYSTLATEIDASYQQELITMAAKNNLMLNLDAVYSNLVYGKCEIYLSGSTLNTSATVMSWLKQVENNTARNRKIDYYRDQINAYNYYSEIVPRKVSNFISPGITNYDDSTYNALKSELKNMPKLNAAYKNKPKFNGIRTNLIRKLEQFNADWATGGLE